VVSVVRRELRLSALNLQIMEVLRCANCVLVSVIERACINLELVLSIIITVCRCQMFRAYDCVLLNQNCDLLAYDLCVLCVYVMTELYVQVLQP